jgi:hypothetical protein
MAREMPALGVERAWLVGDLATGHVTHESDLEIVAVLATDEPFQRRADFFLSHLRPSVGTRFVVYTPAEFEELQTHDRVLVEAIRLGGGLDAG